MRLLRVVAGLAMLCLLGACGGGGGGPKDQPRFTITLDRSSISFAFFEGAAPPTQTINASSTGDYQGTLYVGATLEGSGINPNIPIVVSGTGATISVTAASGLAAGTYTGRINFLACSDPQCTSRIGGTPIPVTFTVTVSPGLRLTPTAVPLSAQSGSATSGDVSLQLPQGQNAYTINVPSTQLNWLGIANQGPSSFTVTARSMPPGSYNATLRVSSGAASRDLPVTYTVSAPPGGARGIVPSPTSLTLSASEGAQASQTLLVSPPTWNPDLSTSIQYGGAANGWLSVTPTTGGYAVTASATNLAQGSYSANIVIATVPAFETSQVPVSFTVGPGFIAPATTILTVDSDTTPAQVTGRARIDVAGGAPPINWTASTTVPWLTLTRASGQTGTDVEFSIDTATLNGWDNFSDHTAQIRVVSGLSNITPIDCNVEVRLRLAEVTGIGPLVLIAGQSSKVIVRGRGFSGLDIPLSRLRFDNGAAASVSLVNDTSLAVDAGVLALGPHTVRVTNALNRTLSTRTVRVIAAGSYAYKAMPLNVSQMSDLLLYDTERQNAYAAPVIPAQLTRFPITSASTVAEPLPLGVDTLGLTPDGHFVVAGQGGLALYDRDTLAEIPGSQFSTSSTPVYAYSPVGKHGSVISNDSRLWYPLYNALHLDTKVASVATLPPGMPATGAYTPVAISRNGERIVGIDTSVNPGFDTFALTYMDASDSVVHRLPETASVFPHVMLSDDGKRVLFGAAMPPSGSSKVLDGQLSLVGYVVLPASASGYEPVTSAISPDGTCVYVLTYAIADYIDGPPAFKPRVYVFDSSTAVTSPPQSLPVAGYFEFNDYPSCRVFGCFSVRGNITADGGALLFVGNRNFVVVPTTAPLTPVSSAPPGGLQTMPWKPSR